MVGCLLENITAARNKFTTANNEWYQGMQSRDSCVQREISSSITLLHTGTIKVQVRSYISSDFISCLRIFSANTLQPVQKSLFN